MASTRTMTNGNGGASPQRSRNSFSASTGSGSGSGSGNCSHNLLRISRDSGDAVDHAFASTTSDTAIIGFASSASFEGGHLASFLGSATSSRGSVVASLNDNFIANSHNHVRPRSVHQRTSSGASSTYVDHCGWAVTAIEADKPDTRKAIAMARGEKKTKNPPAAQPPHSQQQVAAAGMTRRPSQLLHSGVLNVTTGSVNNPLTVGHSATASPLVQDGLRETGRRRSVRITEPPEHLAPSTKTGGDALAQPSPTLVATQVPPLLQQQPQQNAAAWAVQRHHQQQQQQQQQQHLAQVQMLQKLHSQRFVPPPPLSEIFASSSQRSTLPATSSACATPHSVPDHSLTSQSPLTNSTSTYGTSSTTTPLSQQAATKQASSPPRKKRFFLCGGNKSDVATKNSSA